jgi:sphingomyelin phosphodiesterase
LIQNAQGKPVAMQYIAPSLTTFTDINPSFRSYVFDNKTLELQDYIQYRLNLTHTIATDRAEWNVAYTARDEYRLASMSPASWAALIERMRHNTTLRQTFETNFHTGRPYTTSSSLWHKRLCHLRGTTPSDVEKCVQKQQQR